MTEKVAVLGCGWLGMPLAAKLVELGFDVNGSTTRKEKLASIERTGSNPFIVELNPELNAQVDFFEVDTLVINLPPKQPTGQPDFHLQQIQSICGTATCSGVKNVLFVSSTSVYPNLGRKVDESEASYECTSRAGVSLLEVEDAVKKSGLSATIIRFAGLFGKSRNPANFLAGKKNLSGAENPVNLIHLEDCIDIIGTIITKAHWGYTFHACAPDHPSRVDFYTKASKKIGLEPPHFSDEPQNFKIIDPDFLVEKTGYQFKHRILSQAI